MAMHSHVGFRQNTHKHAQPSANHTSVHTGFRHRMHTRLHMRTNLGVRGGFLLARHPSLFGFDLHENGRPADRWGTALVANYIWTVRSIRIYAGDWLSMHSTMLVDWEHHWLSFSLNDTEITLLGSAAAVPDILL